jgi:uncharacterized protein
MKEYFSFNSEKKTKIIKDIKEALLKEESIIFAFVFGSFLDSPSFRDIDIGVFAKGINKGGIFDYELELSKKISDIYGLSPDIFEIKALNFAPYSFLNNIFSRGKLLFSKDDSLLTDMIEETSLEAVANSHISELSLKELVPA